MKKFKVYGLADISTHGVCKIKNLDVQNSYGESLTANHEKMIKGFLEDFFITNQSGDGVLMFTLDVSPFMNKSPEVNGQDAEIVMIDYRVDKIPPIDHEEAFAYQDYQLEI